jgi:hypothetical protein
VVWSRGFARIEKDKGEKTLHHLAGVGRVTGLLLLVSLLGACGGGDDDQSADTELSTHSITFNADTPDAATPAAQTVTATFGADIAHLSVLHAGPGIVRVTSSLAGRTAQISIEPEAPSSIGPGAFTSTVAVTGYVCADAACSTFAAGNTETVSVKYQVSPIVRYVAPYVATAGTSAAAVIRGKGFLGFATQGVKFGTVAATSYTVVSDTEIRATYPALPAGTYAVQLDIPSHVGPINSTAELVVLEPVAYSAGVLAYPTAAPAIRSFLHDAQRSSLLVATNSNGGTILRYSYAGGAWGAPQSVPLSELQDLALSIDGAQLLAISKAALTAMDAATLAPGTAVAAPATLPANSFLKNLAVGNDNAALITTGIAGSTTTPLYRFAVGATALIEQTTKLDNATTGASADGSLVMLIQGDPSVTAAPSVVAYTAADSVLAASGISLKQTTIAPVLDRAATRIALNGVKVYDSSFALLGTLPGTTLAVVFSPDGKRAYTYDSSAPALLTFDTSKSAAGKAFARLGSAVPLVGAPGIAVKMAISPDGGTLFFAGSTQLVIQPTPVVP